jgi:hypothetical protein
MVKLQDSGDPDKLLPEIRTWREKNENTYTPFSFRQCMLTSRHREPRGFLIF